MSSTYVVLGGAPAARAEFTAFLAREAISAEEPVILLPAAPLRDPISATDPGAATVMFWETSDPLPPVPDPDAAALVLPPGGADPRPFLEHLRDWLEHHDRLVSRIFTVVDCAALEADPSLHAYYDLCLHFSDVFLLANRGDVSKKWVREYEKRLQKMAVPTRVEFLKPGGKVREVAALLYPEARRLSQFFDPPDEAPELPVEMEGFGAEEEVEDPREAGLDPYLARGDDGSYRFKLRLP